MRDVTDNRTGELAVGEVKRGRGRPRKANAMTNAERQAAFRARRREQSVTVTKNAPVSRLVVDDVDAYDECKLELEALRVELAEAHETIDELNDELIPLRVVMTRLQEEVDGLNDHFIKLVNERDDARDELAAAKKGAAKAVTNNEKRLSDDLWLDALALAMKGRKAAFRLEFSQNAVLCKIRDLAGLQTWNRLQVVCYGQGARQLTEKDF